MIAAGPTSPVFIRGTALERNGVVAAFAGGRLNISLCIGDDRTAVLANRRVLLRDLGLSGCALATVRQREWAPVVRVTAGSSGTAARTEGAGMVTGDPGIVLMIGSSDCVPVLLADPESQCAGALHVGWRELAGGVVEKGVVALEALGARPERTTALLGPAICAACYRVGPDVQSRLGGRYPEAIASTRSGEPSLDLTAGVRQALASTGVTGVAGTGICTYENPRDWFSRRRDGSTGVQGSFIALVGGGGRCTG